MNKSYDQRIEEERKLARRSRQGVLLTFVFATLSIAGAAFIGSGMQNEWFMVPFMIIFAVGLVLIMGWMIYWAGASPKQEVERSKEVSLRLLPDMPLEEKPSAKKALLWLILILLLPPVAFFLPKMIDNTLERVWPDVVASRVSNVIILSILGSISWLMMWVNQKWELGQEEQGESPSWKQLLFLMAGLWFSTFLIIFSLVGLPWLIKTYDLPIWISILAIPLGTVFPLLFAFHFPILEWWIWRAVKEGDYEQALSRLGLAERFLLKILRLFQFKGKLLCLVGQHEEAQKLFDQALRDGYQLTKSLDSGILNDLGTALLGQGRYEEAIEALKGSSDIKASQVLAYSRLAEVYLYQGTNLKEARKLTERGLQNHSASVLWRWRGKEALIETLAIHAWVLAELGLYDDAAQTLERAFAVAPPNHKPLLAALHLRAGYVSLWRGNRHQAKQHFTTGQELDPRGHYGRLAGSALAKM